MIKKLTFLIGALLTSPLTFAVNNDIQSVIDAFTNCDNSFFYQLKVNADDFEGIADLVIKDDIAYIPVTNFSSEEGHTYYFTKPIEYRGLSITGYQNIYIQTPFLGQYYYWGFIIDDSIDKVKNQLPQLNWRQDSVVSYIANPKLYDLKDEKKGWQNNPYTIDEVITRANTVEKLLYLEPINEKQVHLICSIQGDTNNDLLYNIHPDIKYINQEINERREAEAKTDEELTIPQIQQNESTIEQQNNNDIPESEGI